MSLLLFISSLVFLGDSGILAVTLQGVIKPNVPDLNFLNDVPGVILNGNNINVYPSVNGFVFTADVSLPDAVITVERTGYIRRTVVERSVKQEVNIVLVQEVTPTQVTFPLSSTLVLTPNSGGQSPTKIEIPSGTCAEDANGNQFSGNANVYLNFFNPETSDFKLSSGLFRKSSTEEQLSSYGVFQLRFDDGAGNAVYPRPLTHSCGSQLPVPQESVAEVILSWPNVNATQWPDYSLWKLDINGLWEEIPALRKLRNVSNDVVIGALGPNDIGGQTMMNIAIIESNPLAYVKIRVFTDCSNIPDVIYRPNILMRESHDGIPPMSAVQLFSDATTTPATACHEVRLSTLAKALRITVSLDRFDNGDVTTTTPDELSNYPCNIQTILSSLNYGVNGNEISVDAQTSGLFHSTKDACDSALLISPALWVTL